MVDNWHKDTANNLNTPVSIGDARVKTPTPVENNPTPVVNNPTPVVAEGLIVKGAPIQATPTTKALRIEREEQLEKNEMRRKDSRTPQVSVMEFLKQISAEIKQTHPKLPETVADKIDAYIRDHGNRFPETTKDRPL